MGGLIDADALKDIIENGTNIPRDEKDFNLSLVDRQPIAYDINKVIEQLKKNTSHCYDEDMETEIRFIDINKAIEIVKAGGISE